MKKKLLQLPVTIALLGELAVIATYTSSIDLLQQFFEKTAGAIEGYTAQADQLIILFSSH